MKKNILIHTKYPYTAIIIAIIWLSIAIIIKTQKIEDITVLILTTLFTTMLIAYFGFKSPKK